MNLLDKLPWRIQSYLKYRPKGIYKSFDEYSELKPKLCSKINILGKGYYFLKPPKFSTNKIPVNFYEVVAQENKEINLYSIRNASIYSHDCHIGLITKNNKVIADNTFTYDVKYSNYHPFLSVDKLPKPIHFKGRCLSLVVGGGDTFYWHWMIDSIPKYGLIEILRKTHEDYDFILINEMLCPFHEQTLKKLGIPKEKLICLKNQSHYFFNKIDILSPIRYNPWVISYLRNRMLPFNSSEKPELNIYISRAKARWRKIENEDELFSLLEKKYGFIKVFYEDLTLFEQIEIAQRTKNTVSLVGSNQVNMVFYPKGANIIEIQPEGLANVANWIVAEQCGHNYFYNEAKISESNTGIGVEYRNVFVDIDKIDKHLSLVMNI